MPEDSPYPWIALALAERAGPRKLAETLRKTGGDPEAALRSLAGLRAAELLDRAVDLRADLARQGVVCLTLADPGYPALLRTIPDPPPCLFSRGEPCADDDPAVAVIGSRRATPYGLAMARKLGEDLGTAGISVVSGLARGIDAAAHQGVLLSPSGRGIAVLGCGPDRIYPSENKELAAALSLRGAVLTEFPPGTPPLAGHFPQRNRVIAGLVRAVVVVEAALGSGSLITVRLALDYNREVLAIPGPVTSTTSEGTLRLLQEGARPVARAEEIIREFPAELQEQARVHLAARRAGPPPDLPPLELEIWEALDAAHPRSAEDVANLTGLGVSDLIAGLLGLEIRGHIRTLPGGLYVRWGWTDGGDPYIDPASGATQWPRKPPSGRKHSRKPRPDEDGGSSPSRKPRGNTL